MTSIKTLQGAQFQKFNKTGPHKIDISSLDSWELRHGNFLELNTGKENFIQIPFIKSKLLCVTCISLDMNLCGWFKLHASIFVILADVGYLLSQTDGRTDSDAYEPNVQAAQVISKKEKERKNTSATVTIFKSKVPVV